MHKDIHAVTWQQFEFCFVPMTTNNPAWWHIVPPSSFLLRFGQPTRQTHTWVPPCVMIRKVLDAASVFCIFPISSPFHSLVLIPKYSSHISSSAPQMGFTPKTARHKRHVVTPNTRNLFAENRTDGKHLHFLHLWHFMTPAFESAWWEDTFYQHCNLRSMMSESCLQMWV